MEPPVSPAAPTSKTLVRDMMGNEENKARVLGLEISPSGGRKGGSREWKGGRERKRTEKRVVD